MYSEDMFKEGIPLTSRKFHRILDFYLFHCPVDGTSVRATTFEQQGWKGTLFSTLKREMLERASSSLKSYYYPCTKAELEEKYEVYKNAFHWRIQNMCYRYYMEMSPELRPIIEEANRSTLKDRIVDKLGRPLITEGEVRPTNIVPVIAPNRSGARTVFPMVWGFTLPRSSSPLVNARVESASTKPTFKESWERRRCIIPASYYFEWEHLINAATRKAKTGDKYMIQPEGSAVTWIAGLYRIEDISGIQVPVFTVLTREPSEEIRFIHDRMPVILPGVDIEKWINPDSKPDEIIKNAITDMVFEKIIA